MDISTKEHFKLATKSFTNRNHLMPNILFSSLGLGLGLKFSAGLPFGFRVFRISFLTLASLGVGKLLGKLYSVEI